MSKAHDILIAKCQNNNEKAMMQVYDVYCDAMFSIACRYLNDEDAKDAMQEGFLKAFTNIHSYKPDHTFGAWLKRIIINTCLDVLKKRKIQFSDVEVEDLQRLEDPDWYVNTTLSKEDIIKAIEKLKPKYKVVLNLYLAEGYDHEEISHILDIPVKTSRTHLRRGKLQLQDLLKDKYNEARY
ncbi:RNA polymerase sigma factor [Psychroserpens mesophilus]|uniref:RNA polymerase sigma factor n=1 Tax=Psychroserpens mesophilus TaxID=325473 RepID=UPI003D64D218